MGKAIKALASNPVSFLIMNFILYIFYGVLIGFSLLPSAFLVKYGFNYIDESFGMLIVCMFAGMSVFLFLIMGLFVFGLTERFLSLGLKPGKYPIDSAKFVRWIVYGGVHTLSINLILPFVMGSGFSKIYYRIIGCRFGEDVFINTVGLHDAYLLEIGNNVVIGGKSDITCHTFENGYLSLKKVTIGNNVLIGANVYIMPGVNIGNNCDIGANSLIRKDKQVPDRSLIMQMPGLPARELAAQLNAPKAIKELKKTLNSKE